MKKEKKATLDDEPIYVKVKTASELNVADEDSPGNVIETNANSRVDINEVQETEEELPTIKTDIPHQKIVPHFDDVKVKSKLDEKVNNRVNKAQNQINLVDLAESKEFQTDIRKNGDGSESQSDFDDLEFADVSSED